MIRRIQLKSRAVRDEAWAVAEQTRLILRGRRRRETVSESGRNSARVVVCVHGYLAAGSVFDPLRDRIETELGIRTLDFEYSFRDDFEKVALDFAHFINENTRVGTEIDIVAHSLGGIVARWWLQELGGAASTRSLITLATPHAGTQAARLAFDSMTGALAPDGHVIKRLRQTRVRAAEVRHVALVAGGDSIVTPPASAARVADAQVIWFENMGHNAMLFDESVHYEVLRALEQQVDVSREVALGPQNGWNELEELTPELESA